MAAIEANEPRNGATCVPKPATPRRPVRVSVVVFPECDPSIVYGVFDTLWAAGTMWNQLRGLPAGTPLFRPRIVAAEIGTLQLCTGVSIIPQDAIDAVDDTDVVFVPNVMIGSHKALAALDARLIGWIARMYEKGAQVYSACGGSLVLAAAGLLSGQEATTHWAYVPLFRRHFPDVTLHEDRVLVQSGPGHRIVCGGGASTWQDVALLLIAKYGGNDEAVRISRIFLYQWHRDGQLPYAVMMQNVDHGDAVIGALQTWLAENYPRSDVVAELVRRSGLPKRTFDRRFKRATGYAPLAYVQALRVEEAKQLLETSDAAVEAVASEVGYEDCASFRRLFRRLTGMTPAAYRRKFQPPSFVPRGAAPVVAAAPREAGPRR